MPSTTQRNRNHAFHQQSGRCTYCKLPMWLDNVLDFASRYRLTQPEAMLLQCTAEHKVALQDGGTNAKSNIVAACWWCNSRRHKRKKAPSSDRYIRLVQARIKQGRWHSASVLERLNRS